MNLPKDIKCSVCQVVKDTHQGFSTIALQQYSRNLRSKPESFIRCKKCTRGQIEELPCQLCFRTRHVKWFSKAQRRNPDNAKCQECMRATQLTLPTSAQDAVAEDSTVIMEEQEENERNDESYDIRSNKTKDYFMKNSSGQYYSKYVDDASSVSNPWESQASSVTGSGTSRGAQSSNGRLTSTKLATLDSRFRSMNVNKDKGTTIPSLARRATQSDLNDTDSNDSADTIRGNIKTSSKVDVKGKGVSKADFLSPGLSQQGTSIVSAHNSAYNDSSDEDDDDYQFSRISNDKHIISIYNNNNNNNTGSKVSGHQASVSQPHSATKGNTTLATESLDPEFSAQSRTSRIAASGFETKLNNYAKSRNFARVRPTNMLASEVKNSLVYRGNDIDAAVGRKLPEDDDSDDE